jgi:nicotinamidase-related amidase
MAIVGKENKAVLLVVDAQVGVMQNVWNAQGIIENIKHAVEKARNQDLPVIWIQHTDDELIFGSTEWQLVPELTAVEDEIKIQKQYNSSFEKTALEETLTKLNATHIVLVGAATNWCIRATAYGALERGYDLTLLEDAHTTETIELEKEVTIDAVDIIRELNVVMTWISYPQRTSQTRSVADLDFTSLN